jgi:hypothetical protein
LAIQTGLAVEIISAWFLMLPTMSTGNPSPRPIQSQGQLSVEESL